MGNFFLATEIITNYTFTNVHLHSNSDINSVRLNNSVRKGIC